MASRRHVSPHILTPGVLFQRVRDGEAGSRAATENRTNSSPGMRTSRVGVTAIPVAVRGVLAR